MKRIHSELQKFAEKPPQGCRVEVVDDDPRHWTGSIEGPKGSLYEGGVFHLDIEIPETYPLKPPKMKFLTKIFHPNINDKGEISFRELCCSWTPVITIAKIMESMAVLLN